MDSKQVVEYMITTLPSRGECLALAWDRGRGEGMLIEKWILIFHHFAIAFPLTQLQVEPMLNDLDWLYSAKGFKPEAHWKFSLAGGKTLLVALFRQVDRRANVVNFFKAEAES